jgi:hypothetical protein
MRSPIILLLIIFMRGFLFMIRIIWMPPVLDHLLILRKMLSGISCIQENAEGWAHDKGRRSGINYDYECIKTFMRTDDFHNVSTAYGLDSQILANCLKAFASYLDVPKKD